MYQEVTPIRITGLIHVQCLSIVHQKIDLCNIA